MFMEQVRPQLFMLFRSDPSIDQTWAEILKFPNVPPSLVCTQLEMVEYDLTRMKFDVPKHAKPIEVTIKYVLLF